MNSMYGCEPGVPNSSPDLGGPSVVPVRDPNFPEAPEFLCEQSCDGWVMLQSTPWHEEQ